MCVASPNSFFEYFTSRSSDDLFPCIPPRRVILDPGDLDWSHTVVKNVPPKDLCAFAVVAWIVRPVYMCLIPDTEGLSIKLCLPFVEPTFPLTSFFVFGDGDVNLFPCSYYRLRVKPRIHP